MIIDNDHIISMVMTIKRIFFYYCSEDDSLAKAICINFLENSLLNKNNFSCMIHLWNQELMS